MGVMRIRLHELSVPELAYHAKDFSPNENALSCIALAIQIIIIFR